MKPISAPTASSPSAGRCATIRKARSRSTIRSSASTTRIDGLFQNGYALVDMRLVYETHDRRYSLGVYVNNMFDRAYKTDGQEFSSIGSIRTVYYGAPRTFFVRAGVHF